MKTLPRVVVGFRVHPETARQLRHRARQDGRTISGFLMRLVERELVDEQKTENPRA